MSRIKAAALCLVIAATVATIRSEDIELRDLDVTSWECANQFEGTAQSQDAKERNRMKNRWPVNFVRVRGRATGHSRIPKKGAGV